MIRKTDEKKTDTISQTGEMKNKHLKRIKEEENL